jgi:hypothetical protein
MYISPKSTRIRSRRSTKQGAQFESKVTTLTSRTAYRSVYRKISRLIRSLEKRKGGGGKGGGAPSGMFPTHWHTTSCEPFTHPFPRTCRC